MPSFAPGVAHQCGHQVATDRRKQFIEVVRSRYQDQVSDLASDWNDNIMSFSMKTYGFAIDGTLTVEDQRVCLAGKLPFAAVPFRGKIEQTLKSELRRELA